MDAQGAPGTPNTYCGQEMWYLCPAWQRDLQHLNDAKEIETLVRLGPESWS